MRVQELPGVEEDEEGPALLPPPGEDPLHHLPHPLPRRGGENGRGLVGQNQPTDILLTINGGCSLYAPVQSEFEVAVSITRAI